MFFFSAPSRRPLPHTLQPSRTRSTFAMKLHLCYPLMKLRKTQADRNDCDFSRCCEKKQFCNPRKNLYFLVSCEKSTFLINKTECKNVVFPFFALLCFIPKKYVVWILILEFNTFTADHGRADWLGYWDEFVQKACFKNWLVYVILSKTT